MSTPENVNLCDHLCRSEFARIQEENRNLKEQVHELQDRIKRLVESFSH